ncbi:SRPBCC family protein [Mycolicibacterium sp.]|uniref:SRPBCC family protein n=1 Tax=Mycolicibacterium sp. TaxID=2320850 RepID=UPI001A1F2EE4|nr:SRPBCC family protein [Mycolicibacterium sp.]MBJ7338122.1 SRPBCC family protein [Mycolicibacterium sp.]
MNRGKVALTLVGAAALWGARRYYRNWGATKQESHASMLGDRLIHQPAAQSTDAEWIGARVETVWPRVLDVVLRRRREIDDDDLSVGDVIHLPLVIVGRAMGSVPMSVVDVVDGRSLVLRTVQRTVPVDLTLSWHAEPRWDDRTRLIVRLRIALRHPGDIFLAEAAGPIIAVLVRRRLVAIRSMSLSNTIVAQKDTPSAIA